MKIVYQIYIQKKIIDIKNYNFQCGLLLYIGSLNVCGGLETFVYNFVKSLYNKYDIFCVYKDANICQLNRLKKYVKCIKFKNQKFICDKYICVDYIDNIADNVTSLSGEYLDIIHFDLNSINAYTRHNKTTKHIVPSKIVANSLQNKDNIPIRVIPHLLNITTPNKSILLMSAQRYGKNIADILKFSSRLIYNHVPFIWIFYNDKKVGEENNIIFKKPEFNLKDFYNKFDYFVSFSDTEAYGYSIVEAMSYGLPLIVRDIPVLDELGFIDGKHGYKIKNDMSNIDEVINKIYNIPKCNYKKLDNVQDWYDELGELNIYNKYEYNKTDIQELFNVDTIKVIATNTLINNQVYIKELNRVPKPNEEFYVTKDRLKILLKDNFLHKPLVEVIEE